MNYSYFISYSHQTGFGNLEIRRDALITSISDIKAIKKLIEDSDRYINCVVVLNFTLFTS